MATLEQEQQQRSALQSDLNQLIAIEPESLVRADVLGRELSFESGLPVFKRTLDLFKDLSESRLDDLPYEVLANLTGQVRQALQEFQAVQNFSTNQANPASARDGLIQQTRDHWNGYYTAATPVISYSRQLGTDFDRLEREARGALATVQDVGADARKEKDKMLTEINTALEQVRRVAAQAGVAQQAIYFKEEADAHRKQSFIWLIAAVGFAVFTAIYAFVSLEIQLREIAANVPTGRLIQLALSRVVIISLLSYGLIFSARNFAASRHNFVINRHRQNALSTFETFVKGASDPQIRDAVLVQAAQSIFLPQTSGYLRGEGEAAPPQGSQIIEVIRGVTGTKD